MRWIRMILSAAAVVFFVAFVVRQAGRLDVAQVFLDGRWLLLAVVLAAVSWIGFGVGYSVLARAEGRRTLHFWTASQLTRYVPFNVSGLAARILYAESAGLSKTAVVGSAFLEAGFLIASALVAIGAFGSHAEFLGWRSPWWLSVAAVLVGLLVTLPRVISRFFAALRMTGKWLRITEEQNAVPNFRTLIVAYVVYFASWLLAGASLYASLRGFGVLVTIPTAIAWYVAAWTAGYLAVFVPSGIGVRDGVLIALLATTMPLPVATAIAAGTRLLATAGELLAVGVAAFVVRSKRIIPRLWRWMFILFPTPTLRRMVFFALFVQCAILFVVLATVGERGLFLGDSHDLYQLGVNFAAGHGFSKEVVAPFLPDGQRMPLYTVLLATSLRVLGHAWPVAIVQIILATAIPAVAYRFALAVSGTKRAAHVAAALAAFEPLMLIWPVMLLTETIFASFLAVATWYFYRTIRDGRARDAIFVAALFGLAALTRQNGYPLFVVGLLALVVVFRKRLAIPAVFLATFALVVSPWVVRNYVQFKTFSLTTNGPVNLYSDFAASVRAVARGTSYGEETNLLDTEFARDHGINDFREAKRDPRFAAEAVRRTLVIVRTYPSATIKTTALTLATFFTQDSYLFFAERAGFAPKPDPSFSPSFVFTTSGPLVVARRIWQEIGPFALLPALGRLFWILVTLAAAMGTMRAWRRPENRLPLGIMCGAVLLIALTSVVLGFGINARLRYPVNVFLFVLVAICCMRRNQMIPHLPPLGTRGGGRG